MEAHKLHGIAEEVNTKKAADEVKAVLESKNGILAAAALRATAGHFDLKYNATNSGWAKDRLPRVKAILEDEGFVVEITTESRKDSWGSTIENSFINVKW